MAALAVAAFVILFAPAAPVPEPPTTTSVPGPRITLDELEAMLTDSPGEPPASFQVDTPDGPVTVIVPTTTTTTTPSPTSTSTSTTTTTTTPRPRPTVPAVDVDDILGQLLGERVPTIPEGAGGER